MTENDEDKRILQEEIMGVIPAITLSEKGPQFQCGLVFATNVLIVALLAEFREIWWATKTPRYYALKRDWARYEHKPTASILQSKHYKCYIIPHWAITHVGATGTGRIRKRSTLVFHTAERVYAFKCVTSLETVSKDVSELLRQSGVRFSKGE